MDDITYYNKTEIGYNELFKIKGLKLKLFVLSLGSTIISFETLNFCYITEIYYLSFFNSSYVFITS
jgi:hypothetical protein